MKNIYKLLLINLLIVISSSYSFSQLKNDILKSLQDDINNNNFGNEFWISIPPPLSDNLPNSYNTIRIYAFPVNDSKIKLTVANKNYIEEKNAKAGETVEFILQPSVAQPYLKSGESPVITSDIYQRAAIQFESESPISVYVLVLYNNSSEGFLAYPLQHLGNDYIISSYNDPSVYYPLFNSLPAITTIVSPFDGNEVTFTMGGNNKSLTSDGLKPYEEIKRILNKGDVWVFSSKGKEADLSGSSIKSTMPVSVISGNQYANIPLNNKNANYLVDMETPRKTWGRTFLTGRIYNRKFSPVLRVYAKEDNTIVLVNGNVVGEIIKSNGIIDDAYLEIRPSDLASGDLYAITANKPINVVQYNTGTEEDGLPAPLGSPFKIVLTPYEQFQKTIMFSLPAVTLGDYNSNYVNLYTELDENFQIPQKLELIQFKFNNTIITPVKDLKHLIKGEVLNINGRNFAYICFRINPEGEYAIRSDLPFYASLYGYKNNLSYGFLSSVKLHDLSSLDTKAPVSQWKLKCNGLIEGTTEDLSDDGVTSANLGGHLFISNESENISVQEISKIIPGTTKKIYWALKVNNINKPAKAVIKFWDAASNSKTETIEYNPVKLDFNSEYIYFGSLKAENKTQNKLSLTNNSQNDIYINSISLKFKDKGFKIINEADLKGILRASENIEINLEFAATTEGIFIDSLGIVDSCGTNFRVKLEAVVGNPVIEADDINFGDVLINKSHSEYVNIKNTGVSSLVISGYQLPYSDDFEVDFGREILPSNPLIIEPNDKFTYKITFYPETDERQTDSVVFISDAETKDKTTIINARGIKPGLVAESYDWGRRRIHRTDFPAGPYYPENESKSISLMNTGSTDLKITKVELKEQINQKAFELSLAQLNNLEIKKGDLQKINAGFRPDQLGENRISVEFTDNNGNSTLSTLRGFGVAPKIKSQIFDFDSTVIQSFTNPKVMNILITNLSTDEWEFADTVTIYDIQSENGSTISTNWADYGTQGFKFDKDAIKFPVKIEPGKYLSIPVAFAPSEEGNFSANLKIISDALENPEIKLTGTGLSQDISITDGYGITCINSPVVISSTIKNNGQKDVSILPVTFKNPESEFSFPNDDYSKGFVLKPGDVKNVDITFKPSDQINKTVEIVFQTVENPDVKRTSKITGETKLYKINSKVSPIEHTAEIGTITKVSIDFDNSYKNEQTEITELILSVKFNNKALKPILTSINDGDLTAGKFIRTAAINDGNILQIEYKSLTGNGFNGSGKIIEIPFETYFPNDTTGVCEIEVQTETPNNTCVLVKKTVGIINIQEQCINQLRKFKYSGTKYDLAEINPNPVNSNSLTFNFAIGISAFTELKITNSVGENILLPVSERLEKGNYSITIPIAEISSGVYYYTLKSGPFTDSKKFIISK